jgi:prepilin-type N-terminal cleavage/methylation domain-containing protein
MRPTSRRADGFTLIELLVVIAIIAVLISVLLPALKSARDSAYSTVCISNLRTLAITTQQYANDNDGFLPRSSHSAGFNQLPWAAVLYEPITGHAFEGTSYSWENNGWWNATNTHYRCPHDRRESPIAQAGLPFSLPALSYGFNVYLELTPSEIDPSRPVLSQHMPYARISAIPRPSGTVLMGELVDSSSRDHIMAHFWRTRGVVPMSEIAMHRHGDEPGSNAGYAWIDGHASNTGFSETFDPINSIDRWNPSINKLFSTSSSQSNP